MKFKILLYITVVFLLSSCTNVFYYPMQEQVMTPEEIGLKYEDIWIEDSGQPKLHAWYLPAKNPIATLIHLHGNAENISTHLASVYWLPSQGISVITLDYRGYGLSEGKADIDGIHHDIARTIRYTAKRTDINQQSLVLFGQSLGGSMALYIAAQPEFKNTFRLIVAESPFSGYRSIAREKLSENWLTYPLQLFLPYLVSDQYSASKYTSLLDPQKILLIHGTEDQTVNISNSEMLYKSLGQNCQFWRMNGGTHISAFRDQEMRSKLLEHVKLQLID